MLQDIECAVTQCRERWFVLSWFYQIAEANLCIIEIGDCCAQFPSQGGDNTLRTEKVIGINNQIFYSSADLDQLLWRRSKTTKRIGG
ncbi:Uncharacterised protein [Raoultella terrigena]|uniref:Uncharacterized protein n=1 Tax=Raoultella terrigena TaxID=577 RepID=A0A3P8J204_RAOTE|nr:Uncharacterised protein [Raoultella terrigena]